MNRHAGIRRLMIDPASGAVLWKIPSGRDFPTGAGGHPFRIRYPLTHQRRTRGRGGNPAHSCFHREEGRVPAEPGTRTFF